MKIKPTKIKYTWVVPMVLIAFLCGNSSPLSIEAQEKEKDKKEKKVNVKEARKNYLEGLVKARMEKSLARVSYELNRILPVKSARYRPMDWAQAKHRTQHEKHAAKHLNDLLGTKDKKYDVTKYKILFYEIEKGRKEKAEEVTSRSSRTYSSETWEAFELLQIVFKDDKIVGYKVTIRL